MMLPFSISFVDAAFPNYKKLVNHAELTTRGEFCTISLVVKFDIPIVEPRVRFPDGAFIFHKIIARLLPLNNVIVAPIESTRERSVLSAQVAQCTIFEGRTRYEQINKAISKTLSNKMRLANHLHNFFESARGKQTQQFYLLS
jgi:hypothetical protein